MMGKLMVWKWNRELKREYKYVGIMGRTKVAAYKVGSCNEIEGKEHQHHAKENRSSTESYM
jgi:hypothetical protein